MDVVSAETRSRMMAGIKGRNTRPELRLRKMLSRLGFRYRLHRGDLPGTPDIVMPGRRIAIFVHGCFWHMHANCRYAKLPATRQDWWEAKLKGNRLRDEKAIGGLGNAGWRVAIVWECALRLPDGTALQTEVASWIAGSQLLAEFAGRRQLNSPVDVPEESG